MMGAYTEIPDNFERIEPLVETEPEKIKSVFFSAGRVVFYDACSFQKHSGLADGERKLLIAYLKKHDTAVFITRCILMELASDRYYLSREYIEFIKELSNAEVKVAIFNEEYTYDILSECFTTNEKINMYLTWAVRTVISPISTISATLKTEKRLAEKVIEGRYLQQSDLYYRFFKAVRGNKEHDDNLGEELTAVCIHILSCLPGVYDGKLCVITDDKGAAGKIDSVMKKTNPQKRGAKIILFSTPKLVQHMFQEKTEMSEDEMVSIITQGNSGNIVVMGTTTYDLKVDTRISMTGRELVQKIMEPNGINIVF